MFFRGLSVTDDILPNFWSADGHQLLATDQPPSRNYLVTMPAAGGDIAQVLRRLNETGVRIAVE